MEPATKASTRSVARFLPILGWLPTYRPAWLRSDLMAGITVGAFAVPENLAYAGLAGLPVQYGMYASMMAMAAYAFFGTSRQLAVGATSALSIMVAGTLGALALSPDDYVNAAQFTAIIVAVLAIGAGLLRAGFVVNFISESVLTGFKAGAALFIASSQLAKLFGIEGVQGNFFERIWNVLSHLDETNGRRHPQLPKRIRHRIDGAGIRLLPPLLRRRIRGGAGLRHAAQVQDRPRSGTDRLRRGQPRRRGRPGLRRRG
jgi:SulP family sulfate permease